MDGAALHDVAPASWVLRPRPQTGARVRLFCLPFAGGGASTYHAWPSAFERDVEICAVQLPGRESRMHERRITSALVLAQALADAVEPYVDRTFALFGYSMGALLAFETARELRRRRLPMPAQLFVAAMRAPHIASAVPPLSRLPPDQLVRAVRSHYQPPEDVFQIPELLDLYLPILRDDMALVDDYVYHAEPPLSCAIDAYVGAHDRSTSIEANGRWREQTAGAFAQTVFPGSHFFLRDELPALQRRVAARLDAVIGDRR
jgi:medium-chain acyl-[acyl-carrier-protein] hydrolase